MNALVERERKLVEAIRSLVVREGMMAEGVANMMMSASAPGMLSGLSNDKGKKAVAAAAVSKTKEVVVKDLSKEMEVLKKEVAALKKENDSLQKAKAAVAAIKSTATATATTSASSNSKSGDADKYVKLLSSEVDDLKQKLLSSDERLMDLQQESQVSHSHSQSIEESLEGY
jgi:predicted RNase H-like nuclease (RuvC/YqgF family)